MAAISGRSWGAEERTLELTRKVLVAPIAKYACAAWVPHVFESTLKKVERGRNVALRLQKRYCKTTSTAHLRELTVFEHKHGNDPTYIIFYDDEDIHAVQFIQDDDAKYVVD